MGNRSSSHYPPPPSAWPHGPYGAYTAPTATPGAFDAKRGLSGGPPGAYAEPYVPHPQMRRSMISLNADSGYMTSPSDSERMRMRGSRMSLNHLDLERQLLYPPDPKTMRKLEKMEKKQQKLLKKMGRSVPTAVFLPPQPMPSVYARAMSFDDLNRVHVVVAPNDLRFRDHWRVGAARFRSPGDRVGRSTLSTTTTSGHAVHGDGSLTSSPVTSVSDEHAGDAWRESPLRRGTRDEMSPTSDSSAAIASNTRSTEGNKADKPKSVEIKVQRAERLERREKFDNKDWLNNNDTYAMPRMQPSFGSRSSLATSQVRGESSDIDFSWIREEENKLRKERENLKRLPECYFGIDPPKLEDRVESRERDEKENLRRSNVVRSTTAAFEQELAKDRREQAFKSRSSVHLEDRRQEHSPRREMGPMARRLHRMQREAEVANRDYGDRDECRQRWRSSMAF